MTPVLSVRNLSKRYHLGETASHDTLRDQIALGWKSLFRKSKDARPEENVFWALREVNFDVREGEVLGVIGRNGAGKSTLLKILSRITEPTEGEAWVRGRVSSLLEVGTGFHPELTGRENVFLNGAILGMSRAEIRGKFDEIVAFAEVEKFLDTPVKRYSSGMYVRLAFAVAAHLEPEILIVDEVLAVGDIQFQKKCLGKMEEVGKQGRTVLFVSHNMGAVESLCTRAILLDRGQLRMDGPAREVLRRYIDEARAAPGGGTLAERRDRKGSGAARATRFRVLNEAGEEEASMKSGGDYTLAFDYENRSGETLRNVVVSVDLYDERYSRVLLLRTNFTDQNVTLHPGSGTFCCAIRNLPLANGNYSVAIYMAARAETDLLDSVQDAAFIMVGGGDFFGTGHPGMPRDCKVLVHAEWTSEPGRLKSTGALPASFRNP